MVGQAALNRSIGVRLPVSQPIPFLLTSLRLSLPKRARGNEREFRRAPDLKVANWTTDITVFMPFLPTPVILRV